MDIRVRGSRNMLLNKMYTHGISCGRSVSRIYVAAATSPGSFVGVGHRRI
jgi:hypothetical protein